jgi:subtilase family serine protease
MSPAEAVTLQQMTELTPSEVESENLCQTTIGPENIHCDAQILVLRSNHQAVHFHPEAQQTFAQQASAGPNAASAASSSSAPQTPPQTYSPAWLQQAYDLSYLSQTAGSGDTVALVDYGNDPTAESDLAYWRSHWGLPACTTANGCFKKVNAEGQASPLPPTGPNDWVAEESLDADAVSALCPNCHIILIEVGLSGDGGFDGAQAEAVSMGAKQISNSWGDDETGLPTDSAAYSYPGVAVIASTGDNGYIGNGYNAYPASSRA